MCTHACPISSQHSLHRNFIVEFIFIIFTLMSDGGGGGAAATDDDDDGRRHRSSELTHTRPARTGIMLTKYLQYIIIV